METLSLLAAGFQTAIQPTNFLLICLGMVIGVIAGALPGVTMLMAVVLVLPFTYAMEMAPAILLLFAIYCGGVFGGSITAILFNIPGDPMNVPTAFDGHPLARQGKAPVALGTAIGCSAFGGLVSVLAMTFASPLLAKVALAFSSVEYFAIVVLGLVSVTVIGTASVLNSIISLLIGLFLATVGIDRVSGVFRFDFGSALLRSGIDFVTVMIGIFAVGEVLERLEMTAGSMEQLHTGRTKVSLPFREFWRMRWTIFRSTLVGTLIGVLPGAGATVSAFIGYGVEKQVSKEKDRFGTGVLEGVAAPETANNASTGGAMIPLLALGIPGSGATAVMLAAFLLHGIQPGPLLFSRNLDIVYTIFAGGIIANLLILVSGLLTVRFFVRALQIPDAILGPFIVAFCLVGAYALRNDMADVWIMTIFGILGYFMRRYDYPIPPLVLGLILGPLAEDYFMTSMYSHHGDASVFITRLVSGLLIVTSVAFLLWPAGKKWFRRRMLLKKISSDIT
ncbi:MAG: tripartite tricarboxylate transporter permease [Deltaproteobacteria bacterium]|nr:tripartite tricarboxylate transporter permease [Deltaproteobacteria bacterium]